MCLFLKFLNFIDMFPEIDQTCCEFIDRLDFISLTFPKVNECVLSSGSPNFIASLYVFCQFDSHLVNLLILSFVGFFGLFYLHQILHTWFFSCLIYAYCWESSSCNSLYFFKYYAGLLAVEQKRVMFLTNNIFGIFIFIIGVMNKNQYFKFQLFQVSKFNRGKYTTENQY